MKGRVLAMLVTLAIGARAQAMGWADWWQRPDQQTFGARRQAYSEIQGRQYAAAAQHLESYGDPESLYNRGNALAKAGDLQGALGAYDAALKGAGPDSALQRDARHNRDLVKRQLQAQQQAPNQEGGKDKPPDAGAQGGKEGAHDDRGDAQTQADKGGSQDTRQDADKPPTDGRHGADDASPAQKPREAGQRQAAQHEANSSDAEKREAARREAEELAADKHSADGRNADRRDADGKASSADLARAPGDATARPQTEEAQSLDQWLRWIPDDPGGLLRRKFMIEHMLKQRGGEP